MPGLIGSLATPLPGGMELRASSETPFLAGATASSKQAERSIYLSADLEDECRVAPGDVATGRHRATITGRSWFECATGRIWRGRCHRKQVGLTVKALRRFFQVDFGSRPTP